MVGFTDHFRLLDSFVDVSQGGQVVDVKFFFRNFHRFSLCCLSGQEIMVGSENGTFPLFGAVTPSVSFSYGLFFHLCVLDPFSQKFFLDFSVQAIVEHVDFALHGHLRILPDIPLHGLLLHQQHQIFRTGIFIRAVVNAVYTVFQSFHKLPGI